MTEQELPYQRMYNAELAAGVQDMVSTLPKLDQYIMTHHYGLSGNPQQTLVQISEDIDMSAKYLSHRHGGILCKLRQSHHLLKLDKTYGVELC